MGNYQLSPERSSNPKETKKTAQPSPEILQNREVPSEAEFKELQKKYMTEKEQFQASWNSKENELLEKCQQLQDAYSQLSVTRGELDRLQQASKSLQQSLTEQQAVKAEYETELMTLRIKLQGSLRVVDGQNSKTIEAVLPLFKYLREELVLSLYEKICEELGDEHEQLYLMLHQMVFREFWDAVVFPHTPGLGTSARKAVAVDLNGKTGNLVIATASWIASRLNKEYPPLNFSIPSLAQVLQATAKACVELHMELETAEPRPQLIICSPGDAFDQKIHFCSRSQIRQGSKYTIATLVSVGLMTHDGYVKEKAEVTVMQ